MPGSMGLRETFAGVRRAAHDELERRRYLDSRPRRALFTVSSRATKVEATGPSGCDLGRCAGAGRALAEGLMSPKMWTCVVRDKPVRRAL